MFCKIITRVHLRAVTSVRVSSHFKSECNVGAPRKPFKRHTYAAIIGISAKKVSYTVGNKAKVRISKRLLQENKARQNFWKINISYTLTNTRTCACQGVRNVRKIWRALFSCINRFEIRSFVILLRNWSTRMVEIKKINAFLKYYCNKSTKVTFKSTYMD